MKKSTVKETTGTTLATGKEFTQNDIPKLLEIVNKKIADLKGDREKASRITGTLGQFGKISDIQDSNVLMGAYAYITKKGEAIEACKGVFQAVAPTVKVSNFKEGGATVKQWQEEILMQYKEVVFKEELAKLETVKQKLQDNLSAEAKLKATLGDIAEILKVEE